MLIHGKIAIQEVARLFSNAPEEPFLRSILLTKKVLDDYYISVKNSKYPNCIDYRLEDLDSIFIEISSIRKLILLFKQPPHEVLVNCDTAEMKRMLLKQLGDILDGKNVLIAPREIADILPRPTRMNKMCSIDVNYIDNVFVGFAKFDDRALSMKHLHTLILETCDLPMLPIGIGELPIRDFSLSGSKLTLSQYDRDTFWDWMTGSTICNTLRALKMDSVGLQKLPFEILYLKNLKTLSIAENKLKYLPPLIGELSNMVNLNVADNCLSYFPESLFSRIFNLLDISGNPFSDPKLISFDHIHDYQQLHEQPSNGNADISYGKSLLNASFNFIINKCVKFKRQDIPRQLWHYFNVIGRCDNCYQFNLPQFATVTHISIDHYEFPPARLLRKSPDTVKLQFQSILCQYQCKPY